MFAADRLLQILKISWKKHFIKKIFFYQKIGEPHGGTQVIENVAKSVSEFLLFRQNIVSHFWFECLSDSAPKNDKKMIFLSRKNTSLQELCLNLNKRCCARVSTI